MEQAKDMSVASGIMTSSDEFALAKLDIVGAVAGDLVLSPSDNRGALDMELIGSQAIAFGPAGNLASATTTLGASSTSTVGKAKTPFPSAMYPWTRFFDLQSR